MSGGDEDQERKLGPKRIPVRKWWSSKS